MITFFLNGKPTSEVNIAPDMTILRYLRSNQGLTGTKEGCASGDCGACTVLLGEFKDERWHYKAINACITFLAQINGMSLITVEALANGENLHPAQQAMIEKHGSQCGFCTPGIVMSLAALFENSSPEKTHNLKEIQSALSGNLCRCTGYKPIIEAAQTMKSCQGKVEASIWNPDVLTSPFNDEVSDAAKQLWNVSTEEELKHILLQHPDARIVAGATDLALEVTQMHRPIEKLVAINQIESLKAISEEEHGITIGAATALSDCEEILHKHYPEFGQLLERFAARQVRNQATIGGNIANASPIGDTPPVLIALNAEIEIGSTNGNYRIPLERFYLGYKQTSLSKGEYIRAILVPILARDEHLKVYKISKRLEDDISAVLMALKIKIEDGVITDVRSGFGGMAAVPKSGKSIEAALLNQPMTLETFQKAAKSVSMDFQPVTDVRASADYRIQVTQGLLQKAAIELIHPTRISRVEDILTTGLSSDEVVHAEQIGHA